VQNPKSETVSNQASTISPAPKQQNCYLDLARFGQNDFQYKESAKSKKRNSIEPGVNDFVGT
jgi:hypothetical protein